MASRTLISGGTVVDGTGAPRVRADVLVEGDRIVAIGTDLGDADHVIDADGLVVAPGFVETPLYDAFGPEARDAILTGAAAALPGGRVGRADEVGEAIAFLLGNGFMNGEILHIDGGGRLV